MKEVIIVLAVLLMVFVTYKFYEIYAITEKYHKRVEELIRKNHENDPDWEDTLF